MSESPAGKKLLLMMEDNEPANLLYDEKICSFLIFNFRYSELSDEQTEDVKSVAADESTLVVMAGIQEKYV